MSSSSHGTGDRCAKLRRLNDLRAGLPFMSQSALAAFLAAARDQDLPDVKYTRDVREARDLAATQDTPYGKLIETMALVLFTSQIITIDITNPHAFLYVAASCAMFSAMLLRTYELDPCSAMKPWLLILYADEATPGNAMKMDNKRIMQCIYWSIINFGAAALAKEDFWFVGSVVASKTVHKVSGGMSQVIAGLLKVMFSNNRHNMETAGINVVLHNGTTIRIFVKLGSVLCDESALHQIWLCKGAAGTKPCLECRFIVNPAWIAADELTEADDLVLFSKVFDVKACRRHNKHSIHAIVDELARAKPLLSNELFGNKDTLRLLQQVQLLLQQTPRPRPHPFPAPSHLNMFSRFPQSFSICLLVFEVSIKVIGIVMIWLEEGGGGEGELAS